MTTMSQFSLAGKLALVTGGSGFLGRMICKTIFELGGRAFSVDVKNNPDIICDITNRRLVHALAGRFSPHIIVNNAVGNQAPVGDPDDGWDQDIAIGLTGAENMLSAFAEALNINNGVVLNIGSDLGLIGPDQSLYKPGTFKPASYSAVKHGMIGLTRYYASIWGGSVRVNCLCPGGIDRGQTVPRTPMGRLGKSHELSGAVAFMLSDASSYMTGAVISVDGGRTAI